MFYIKYLTNSLFPDANPALILPKDSSKGIQSLPKEILSVIFSHTDVKTLISVIPLVSKQWKDLSAEPTLLKSVMINLINANLQYETFVMNIDWKNATKEQCLVLHSQINTINSLEKRYPHRNTKTTSESIDDIDIFWKLNPCEFYCYLAMHSEMPRIHIVIQTENDRESEQAFNLSELQTLKQKLFQRNYVEVKSATLQTRQDQQHLWK